MPARNTKPRQRAARGELAALADHYGVTDKTVAGWRRRRLVVLNTDGTVNREETDAHLKLAGLGPYQYRNDKRFATPGKGPALPAAAAPRNQPPADDVDVDSMSAIERRKQSAMARKHELDVLEREGKLVSDDEARVFAFSLANAILDRISTLPARHGHEVAAELNAPAGLTSAVLERVIRGLLTELASDLEAEHGRT